jgi:WD40 repeat protein
VASMTRAVLCLGVGLALWPWTPRAKAHSGGAGAALRPELTIARVGEVEALRWSPDQRWLAAFQQQPPEVHLYEASGLSERIRLEVDSPAIAFSRDAGLIAYVGREGHVNLFDGSTQQLAGDLTPPGENVRRHRPTAIAFSDDNTWVGVGDSSGRTVVFHRETRTPVLVLPRHTSAVTALAFVGTDAIDSMAGWTVFRFRVPTGEFVSNTFLHYPRVEVGAGHLAARRLSMVTSDGRLTIAEFGEPAKQLSRNEDPMGSPRRLDFDARGEHLVAIGYGGLAIWKLQPVPTVMRFGGHMDFAAAELRPDGKEIATFGNGELRVWRLAPTVPCPDQVMEGAPPACLNPAASRSAPGTKLVRASRVAWEPQGNTLVVETSDGRTWQWGIGSGDLGLLAPERRGGIGWSTAVRRLIHDDSGPIEAGKRADPDVVTPDGSVAVYAEDSLSPARARQYRQRGGRDYMPSSRDDMDLHRLRVVHRQRRITTEISLPHPAGALAISSDGALVAVGAEFDQRAGDDVDIYEVLSGKLLAQFPVEPEGHSTRGWVRGLAFSPSSAQLAIATAEGALLFDVKSGARIATLDAPPIGLGGAHDYDFGWLVQPHFRPDGKVIAFSGGSGVVLWIPESPGLNALELSILDGHEAGVLRTVAGNLHFEMLGADAKEAGKSLRCRRGPILSPVDSCAESLQANLGSSLP